MFDFRLLDTFYDIDILLEYPDYRHTRYQCREHLVARYNKETDLYSFRLEGREGVLINQETPSEVMDLLMIEAGNLLYPLSLAVSLKGDILHVENFEEVQASWLTKAQQLAGEHPTHHFRRYLEIASRNMKTEDKLREALLRNSFVSLVVKPLDTAGFMFSFNDFPSKGMIATYHCSESRTNKTNGIVMEYTAILVAPMDYEGDGYIRYTFSEYNDIEEVDARFDLMDTEGQKSVKYISIRTDKQHRSITRKKSFWNCILE